MTARYVQKGEALDYRPSENVNAGDIIVQGGLIGIARLDIKAGELGALALTGVFEINKASGIQFAVGDAVYWSAADMVVTSSSTGTTYIGRAVTVAAASADSVCILLNSSPGCGR